MIAVNIHEAKTHLSRLLDRVSKGDLVVIGRAGEPIAQIVPYRSASRDRIPGLDRGKIRMADDFDDLPEEILRNFEA
jgi:prevent-host-death family protein